MRHSRRHGPSARGTGSRARGAVTGALLLLACLVVATLGPVPSAQAVIDPGSIAGIVTDVDGDPLPGITVTVFRQGRTWVAETDAAGAFQVDNLAADSFGYYVRFSDPGATYATEWYDDQAFLLFGNVTNVPVKPYETTRGVDATMEPAATIGGRVTTATGAPIPGVRVGLWFAGGSTDAFAQTDEDGRYTIGQLKQGPYVVEFYDPATGLQEFWDNSPSWTGARWVALSTGASWTADAALGGFVRNVSAPTIAGTAQVGRPLTASAGSWTPTAIAMTYRWVVGADSVPRDDPTGPVYVPTVADVGQTIRVLATGTALGWVEGSAWSAPSAPVAAARVTNVVRPRVKGILRVGRVARVAKGVWGPPEVALSYRWYAAGRPIPRATHRRLPLIDKYVGTRLRVKVRARADGFDPATAWTRPTRRVRR